MSIYGSRRRWKDFHDLHHRIPSGTVPGAGGQAPEEVDEVRVDRGADWAHQRKAKPADFILPSTRAWLSTLPAEIMPVALATHYPRIVNTIAMHWSDKRGCPELFDELLSDRRGGRAGFPAASARDLLNLQEYWYNGHAAR